MNRTSLILLTMALPAAAFAQVNPAQPMVTGRGNVGVRPAHVLIANQTAKPDDSVQLDKFVVTGSLLKPAKPAKPVPASTVPARR